MKASQPFQSSVMVELNHLLEQVEVKITHCLGQLDTPGIWKRPGPDLNSSGHLIRHICGNLRQWVLSGVGGRPDGRDRHGEFADQPLLSGDELLRELREVFRSCRTLLGDLTEDDLMAPRVIQGFDVSVLGAIQHSVAHAVGHTHQIVLLTRLACGPAYRFQWSEATPRDSVPL